MANSQDQGNAIWDLLAQGHFGMWIPQKPGNKSTIRKFA